MRLDVVCNFGSNPSSIATHILRNFKSHFLFGHDAVTLLRATALLFIVAVFGLAAGAFAQSEGCGFGPCGETHVGTGCVDINCCSNVCAYAPHCCDTSWDEDCLNWANEICEICGIPGLGSCFISRDRASCADPVCCALVCSFDSFCCEAVWDLTCSITAQDICTLPPPMACGDPLAGDCLTPHGNSSCSDPICCETVCAGMPNCCSVIWDDICTVAASNLCNNSCTLQCPVNTSYETEACGSRTNDPSIRPDTVLPNTPQPIGTNSTICGSLFTTNEESLITDVDVYSLDLRYMDTDRDGFVKVAITLSAIRPVFAALVPQNSTATALPGAQLLVNAAGCASGREWMCVAPLKYWVVVAPGTNGIISNQLFVCEDGKYWFQIQTSAACSLPCTNATGSCFSVHASPSCVNPACCSLVCETIPYCCETTWDEDCATIAALDCGAPAPSNDSCATPLIISAASTSISMLGSTASLPAFSCPINNTATGGDVWFSWTPLAHSRSTYQIDVCGTTVDTRMEVFKGSCSDLTLVACSDNNIFCDPNRGSRVSISSECGASYLIRLASVTATTGFATLHVTALSDQISCCVADLDASGHVDSNDVALVLLDFGVCGGCATDQDGSGMVDSGDVALILLNSGACP